MQSHGSATGVEQRSEEDGGYEAPLNNSYIQHQHTIAPLTHYSRTFANYFEYMNIVEYGPMIMNYFTLAFGATGTDDIVCFIEGMRGRGRTKPQVPL